MPRHFNPHIQNDDLVKAIGHRMQRGRGVMLLLAPPGSGKTTYALRAAEQLQKENKKVIYISKYDNIDSFFDENGRIGFHTYLKNMLGVGSDDNKYIDNYDQIMRDAYEQTQCKSKYCIILDNADQLFKIKDMYRHVVGYGEDSSNSGCYNFVMLLNNPEHAVNLIRRNHDKIQIITVPQNFKLTPELVEKVFEHIPINEDNRNQIIKQCLDNGTIAFVDQIKTAHLNGDDITKLHENNSITNWSWQDYDTTTIWNKISDYWKKESDKLEKRI